MAATVDPVVYEVVGNQRRYPNPDRVGGQHTDTEILKSPDIDAERQHPNEYCRHLTQDAEVEARDGIGNVIGGDAAAMCDPCLNKNRGHEYWDGIDDRIHQSIITGTRYTEQAWR